MNQAKLPIIQTEVGGRHAVPVVVVDGEGEAVNDAAAIVLFLVATNGDRFPNDCETTYTYDESGLNVATITKTTPGGAVYVQTWTRNGSQLGSKSGWVKR